MQSPSAHQWNNPRNFEEEQFIQNARAYAEMRSVPLPQPNEDFEPYLSQYSEYDSVLSESMSSDVQELGISSNPYDSYDGNSSNAPQMTITPATLAKYSKIMNMNASQPNPNDPNLLSPSKAMEQQQQNYQSPMTPETSPMKKHPYPSNDLFFTNPSQQQPSTPSASNNNINNAPPITPPSTRHKGTHNNVPRLSYPNTHGESESDIVSSPEPGFSPMERSPDPSNSYNNNGYYGPPPPDPNIQTSMDVYSSLNMAQIDQDNASIAWQPVITAPKNDKSQEIIKSQQASNKSNRKSCLPPGKVDSYMAGPNYDGMFECLYPNCNKLFRRRYNVRSHIQTHLCDRPYSCDSCGASFVRPHDLRRHEKCHQDDRPFTCPCGKSFTRHDALQRHRIRMICSGGIEIPGRPKRIPAKRGRPRKNPLPNSGNNHSTTSESESDNKSPVSSPEQYQEYYYTSSQQPTSNYNNNLGIDPMSGIPMNMNMNMNMVKQEFSWR